MKVAIVAVMVVLAMGVAFVGGLLVASKVIASREERAVKPPPITTAEVSPKEEGAKGKEGGIGKGLEAAAPKKEEKKLTTDELIALVDYNITESRDAGKLLMRKKVAENMKATTQQLELESDKAKEKERLEASVQRWLDRSKSR